MSKTSALPVASGLTNASLVGVQDGQTVQIPAELLDGSDAKELAVQALSAVGDLADSGVQMRVYDATLTEDLHPLATDSADGVLIGFLRSTGKAVGSLIGSVLAQSAVLGRRAGGDDLRTYFGAEAVQPLWVDAADGVLLGIDTSSGNPVGVVPARLREEIAAVAQVASTVATVTRGALLGSTAPQLAGWNGCGTYGQSLSVGAAGQPPVSTTQPYANLTFGGGPKATGSGLTTSKPLVEDSLQEGGTVGSNRGETPCSGMANRMVEAAARDNGMSPASLIFFAGSPGRGGKMITELNKGTSYYTNFLAQVTAAKSLATAAGKSYAFHFYSWIQGETDCDNGTSFDSYLASIKQLATDLDADIRAITGQTFPVRMLINQPAYKVVSAAGAVQLAQLEAVRQHSLIHFVTPIWDLPYYTDNLHLVANGYLRLGRRFGRAGKQLVVDGRVPDCLWPLSATIKSQTLDVKFRVPRSPLVFDASLSGTITDMGFCVKDDTGVIALSGLTIVNGDTVRMTLARAVGANPKVRYAMDYRGGSVTVGGGATGNLRDSTQDTEVLAGATTYPMYHLPPHFELPIISLDANA